jgi:hypothetical protein
VQSCPLVHSSVLSAITLGAGNLIYSVELEVFGKETGPVYDFLYRYDLLYDRQEELFLMAISELQLSNTNKIFEL